MKKWWLRQKLPAAMILLWRCLMAMTQLIGEGGATISGGERQRLSIARAMLKDAPVVILDEATANVDPENEAELQAAIEALTGGKTIIMIAHRLKNGAPCKPDFSGGSRKDCSAWHSRRIDKAGRDLWRFCPFPEIGRIVAH